MRIHKVGLGTLANGAAVALMLLLFPVDAARAQGKQEDSLTQREFNNIVETKSSVKDEPATSPPEPIHNLSDEAEAEVEKSRGIKVISGRDWKKETPEERDAHLRRIKATMPPNSHLLITVPQGDVWLIGGDETDPNYEAGDTPPDDDDSGDEALADRLEPQTIAAGRAIVQRGTPSDSLVLVVDGKLLVSITEGSRKLEMAATLPAVPPAAYQTRSL